MGIIEEIVQLKHVQYEKIIFTPPTPRASHQPGQLLRPQLDKGGKVSFYYTPWTFTYEIPSGSSFGWKVLMVAQIDIINLRHRAQGARCLAPQYVLFDRLSSNLSFKAQKGK